MPGISKLKGFKYPPVFPIVHYNGESSWSAEKIADLFEEDFDYIQKISEAAIEYAPDYDTDKIYAKLHDDPDNAIKA